MGFWEANNKGHNQKVSVNNNASSTSSGADQSFSDTEMAVNEAFLALGKQYYEDNKDNTDADYYEQIVAINELKGKEELFQLYKLSLEGKTKCENCNSIITSDSAFCNRCGSAIKPRDFSSLGITQTPTSSVSVASRICPQCGSRTIEGAMFCEKCGQRL